jgi:hypothetical protein
VDECKPGQDSDQQPQWSPAGALALLILGTLAIAAAIWLMAKQHRTLPWQLRAAAIAAPATEAAPSAAAAEMLCPNQNWTAGERT